MINVAKILKIALMVLTTTGSIFDILDKMKKKK